MRASMIGSCLPEKKSRFKQKINVFLNIYTTLQYLTVFDSSSEVLIDREGHEALEGCFLRVVKTGLWMGMARLRPAAY
jgi:hypothetical protein